jgi:hypothetical protein
MKIEDDDIVMSTGRRFYANFGTIGLGDDLEVSHGGDGGIPAWPGGYWSAEQVMTEAERRELADYMIALWTKFRDADGPIKGA